MKTKTILPRLALVFALSAFSGCKNEPPSRLDYIRKDGTVIMSRVGGFSRIAYMHDLDNNGHIDAIILPSTGAGAGKQYLAIDGNNAISRRNAESNIDKYILMDSSMISMADQIADLENDLGYRIDSTFYASPVMHP
jgi:hypothetical protein